MVRVSDYYPDTEMDTVLDRLDVVIRLLDGCSAISTAARHAILLPSTHGYDIGKKYIRVWSQQWSMPYYCDACAAEVRENQQAGRWDYTLSCEHEKAPKETQRFVCFFVQRDTEDVWKAAGWKGPALNFTRGNIRTPEGRYAITGGRLSDTGHFYGGF